MGQTGRIEGNNFMNDGQVNLSVEIAPRWSTVVGYENIFVRYEKDQYAATLDRMENYGTLDLQYLWRPTTVVLVGGRIGNVDYDSGKGLAGGDPSALNPNADIRNTRTYFAYGGFKQSFTPNFTGSLKAGAQVQDWVNFDQQENETNPFLDFNLTYQYDVNSTAQFGVIHRANTTDMIGSNVNNPVLNQESTAFYAIVSHAFTAKFTGSVQGTYQNSEFVGGQQFGGESLDGQTENWWTAGVTLNYAFTRYLSGNVSYYYDSLNSAVNVDGYYYRNYDRNRVFFGIVLTY
jgi:hypothetical protein